MRTLNLDELDHVGGGLSLGLLPQLTQQQQLNPLGGLQPGYGAYPGGLPQQFDPGLFGQLGQLGQLGQQGGTSLPQIAAVVNQIAHMPVVSQLIGSLAQQNPQLGQLINTTLSALSTGNIGAALPQLLGAFGGALGQGQGQPFKF